MAQSLANFDGALKNDYGPGLRNSINNNSAVWANVAKNEDDVQGRQAVWSVHVTRSGASGSRGELGVLPTAEHQGTVEVRDNLATNYHTIKVSGPAIELTQSDEGAFTRALEIELKGAEKDLKFDVARQAFNTAVSIGGTLYLGALTGVASSLVSTVTFTFSTAATSSFRHFFRNMPVDIINGSTGAVRESTTVVSVSASAKTVTVASNANGGVTGDYLARKGNFAVATTWGYEINGLPFLLSSSQVYANINPSSVPEWAGNAIGSSTTSVSDVIFERANDLVHTDGDGGEINLWIAETSQETKLAQTNAVQRRIDAKVATLPSGWEGVQLKHGTLVTDRLCPTNKVFGINNSEIARFVGYDFSWDDIGRTSVLYKALDGSDAVEARYKSYHNLNVTNRNSHVIITLAEPTF